MSSSSSTSLRTPSIDEAIQWLAEQRKHPDRQSAKVMRYGERVIEGTNIASKLGDEQWSFLEQVGLAALDMGNLDLASLCIRRLETRFPQSARAAALQGMLLEARGEYEKAYQLYDRLLQKDESNQILVKRLIAVLKCMPEKEGVSGPSAAIRSLTKYLDTFYTDAEAWQELAAIYLSLHSYAQAAFAMEELILLEPFNTFHVLQYAETLATMNELPRAYKQYLRVLEMCGTEATEAPKGTSHPQGPWTRALWGLKTVTGKLLAQKGGKAVTTVKSADGEAAENVEAVDAMVTDLLLNKAYAGSSNSVKAMRDAARRVLAA